MNPRMGVVLTLFISRETEERTREARSCNLSLSYSRFALSLALIVLCGRKSFFLNFF